MERAAFAPKALPPSLKLRRTAVALAEAGRRFSRKLDRIAVERRREAFSRDAVARLPPSRLRRFGSRSFRPCQLDHPERDVEADDAGAAGGKRESNVSRAGRQIERAGAGPRRRQIDQPPLPAPILAVRQRARDEV